MPLARVLSRERAACSAYFENEIRNEEHHKGHRVPIANIEFQVLAHASDSSIGDLDDNGQTPLDGQENE